MVMVCSVGDPIVNPLHSVHASLLPLTLDVLKISDFGLSTVFRHMGKERKLSRRCGTPPYIAPEVCVAVPCINRRLFCGTSQRLKCRTTELPLRVGLIHHAS